LGRTSEDLHFGKTFSWPLSKKETLIKAEDIAKEQGISTSISQLVVNLVTDFVERNESIIQNNNAINPLNIRYHSSTISSNDDNNKNHKIKTLDELLEQVNDLYEYMADDKNQDPSDFTRIEASAIQLQKYAKKGFFDRRNKQVQSNYENYKAAHATGTTTTTTAINTTTTTTAINTTTINVSNKEEE
jgi:hypothetical protein